MAFQTKKSNRSTSTANTDSAQSPSKRKLSKLTVVMNEGLVVNAANVPTLHADGRIESNYQYVVGCPAMLPDVS